MAIYAPTTDYSATANAIGNKYNAKRMAIGVANNSLALASNQLSEKGLDLSARRLDLQQERIDLAKTSTWMNFTIGAAGLAVDAFKVAKEKKLQEQMDTAKTTSVSTTLQLFELAQESQLNQKTKIVQDENGVWDIQMDESLTQWYNDQISAIDESDDVKEVKQYRKQALASAWGQIGQSVISNSIKMSEENINAQYELGLSQAMQMDMESGGYESGKGIIYSREDLSKPLKDMQFAAYQQGIDFNRTKGQVMEAARINGISAATELAHSMIGQYGITEDDAQTFIASAARVDTQMRTKLESDASTMMAQGLEQGTSPSELYASIEDIANSTPEERRPSIKDSARQAHAAWATKQGYALANADLQSVDVEYLTKQRDSITKKDGTLYNSVFSGLDQTAATFGAMYDKRIDELKKLETTTLANLTKEQVKENKTVADATLAMLKNGEISPARAMQVVGGLNTGKTDSDEDDLYQMQMLTRINDEIVPERYKPLTTKFLSEMESLKFGLKIDSKKGMTVEQTIQIAEARDFANTAIANIFMNTAAKEMSKDEVAEQLGMIKSTFISKSVEALESGEVVDKWKLFNDPNATDDALDKNHQFGGLATVALTLDRNGTIQWQNQNQKATYDAVSEALASQLQELGIQLTSEDSPIMVNNAPKPVPMFKGKVGEDGQEAWVTVNKNDVFASEDGKTWEPIASIDTKASFKTETPMDRFFDQFRSDEKPEGNKSWSEKLTDWFQKQKAEKDPDGRHKQL